MSLIRTRKLGQYKPAGERFHFIIQSSHPISASQISWAARRVTAPSAMVALGTQIQGKPGWRRDGVSAPREPYGPRRVFAPPPARLTASCHLYLSKCRAHLSPAFLRIPTVITA